jgi:hypothetical protein
MSWLSWLSWSFKELPPFGYILFATVLSVTLSAALIGAKIGGEKDISIWMIATSIFALESIIVLYRIVASWFKKSDNTIHRIMKTISLTRSGEIAETTTGEIISSTSAGNEKILRSYYPLNLNIGDILISKRIEGGSDEPVIFACIFNQTHDEQETKTFKEPEIKAEPPEPANTRTVTNAINELEVKEII